MSELAEAIASLHQSQEILNRLARGLEKDPVYGQLEYQEKINDLRDYSNGLSVCTYLEEPTNITIFGDISSAALLREQVGLIGAVIAQLSSDEGKKTAAEAYGLNNADIRRITMSLQGMIELNNLLRQEEDLVLDASKVTEAQTAPTTAPAEEKKGFFKKLFGR